MSSASVELSHSVNQNEVVRGDREELDNDRAKRSKTDIVQWFEEQLSAHTKFSIKINGVLCEFSSKHHNVAFVDTKAFGEALVINGKLKIAQADEFIFYENIVHHALLQHPNPKTVFIMGGGDGSTAREVLKYHKLKKVVLCDIDKEMVDFCRIHLTQNKAAFDDPRLHIVINDAKAELEKAKDMYDVIIGDLADPIIGGPSNGLYTKSFYQEVVKPKLKKYGIFVTQAGLAGVLSHKEIFSPVYNTMKQVFEHVVAYTAAIPSFADTCGWVLGTDEPTTKLDTEKALRRMKSRMSGEMYYLDPTSIASAHVLNKTVLKTLMEETRVITTEENLVIFGGNGNGGEHGASSQSQLGEFVGISDDDDDAYAAALEALIMQEDDQVEVEGAATHDPFMEAVAENDPEAVAKGTTTGHE